MTTQSTSVLKMLQEIAAKEVDMAAEALAKSIKFAEEAKAKQDMLSGYRQDYVNNLNKILVEGMGTEVYQNFYQFFAKLDQAISGQQQAVDIANQKVQVNRQLWQESQRKKLSYEVLLKRSDKRELKVEQKKDQKMMDEYATRITRPRHSS